jgi:FAD/FMN-containing dehydrogenase/Fe-S oxidoreductase
MGLLFAPPTSTRYHDLMSAFVSQQREAVARHLRDHLAGEARFDPATRRLYATDASIYQIEPLGVVFPRDASDVRAAVQICAEARVPITPRGGGTSLSGQAIGPGVLIDCSRYMNALLDVDPQGLRARVQPGVVLDQLNRELSPLGLQFGPDVSTSSRACLGGMIGNNSAGSRSIVYGKTVDHVRRLNAVLADGSALTFDALSAAEWEEKASRPTREGRLYRDVRRVVEANRAEVAARFPRILRRVSGYNLPELCAPGKTGLHQLLVGSEGTLAVLTEAEVALVRKPRFRGLLVPQFDSLAAALDALPVCLEAQPSAVELMDHLLIELTAGNLALRDTTAPLDRRARALLMAEVSSDDEAEVRSRVEKLAGKLRGTPGMVACLPAVDASLREPLWSLRRAAMPLLYSLPGKRKPVTFVEDCAVAPERLPRFIAEFRALLRKHGTDGAFYGHASVGCLHIRPLLDLKDQGDVARMRAITEEVTSLVLAYQGSLSGEHGDGLARSEWNEKMFGPVIYRAFQEVKKAFDPDNVLNPGKIVAAPPMTESLRYPPGHAPYQPPTVFDFERQGGLLGAAEACNGNAACRKVAGGTMCPSFRATHEERDSTRGRANALRHALSLGPRALRERWLFEVFDLCLMCKGCKSECPTSVDVGKLKAELLQAYYQGRPRPLEHLLVAGVPLMHRLMAPLAPAFNWIQESTLFRWALEKAAGIDRRRSLPRLHADHFRRWHRRHRPDASAGKRGQVLLLADCFTTYQEPNVGRAAVRVLERAGYSVTLLEAFCCGRVWISKGMLHLARARIQAQAASIARKLPAGVPILGLEPSCLLALADDWTELAPGPETRRIADAAKLADVWLAEQVSSGACELKLTRGSGSFVVHGHCHQKALLGNAASAALVKLVPGLDVKNLDAGCCGMAGAFGYGRKHFDLSARIAGLALLPALAESPGACVAATGTSCRHQVKDLAGRHALHPLEVVEKHLEVER